MLRGLERIRGLTDTREGRLTVIVAVGGTLVVVAAWANVLLANAADDQARRIRAGLRTELAAVSDEVVAAFPDGERAGEIGERAGEALEGERARVLGVGRPEGPAGEDEVVVTVESGWGWQLRCIRAELRGHQTVLTEQRDGPC